MSISLTSTAPTDQFDAEVINPFGDATDPIRADSRLNGAVKETPAKILWDHQTVSIGTTTLTWDGTDSGNTAFLRAAPYIIRISRSEDNPDVPISFDVLATIDSTKVDASFNGAHNFGHPNIRLRVIGRGCLENRCANKWLRAIQVSQCLYC